MQDYIADTIQSVLGQGYPNLEYIIIDGAGDDTYKILRKYESQLAYWCSEQDNGQYDAINKGFAKATGDILFWLNADDMLLPKSLFVVSDIFSKFNEVRWISSLMPCTWDAEGSLCGFYRVPGFSKKAFFDGFFLPDTSWRPGVWIQQESTFFRRDLWNDAGAKIPDYGLAGDFALWCEFYRHADLYGVEYPLGGFRLRRGQKGEAIERYNKEARSARDRLRGENKFAESIFTNVIYSRIARLPKIRRFLANTLGYDGRSIVNTDKRRPRDSWMIQKYKFLPRG